jgi:hypothetical protein
MTHSYECALASLAIDPSLTFEDIQSVPDRRTSDPITLAELVLRGQRESTSTRHLAFDLTAKKIGHLLVIGH